MIVQVCCFVQDCAEQAGTTVQGGQTSVNPWVIIGGVATSVCTKNEIIIPENAIVGDVLVLTKPLGTQVRILISIGQQKEKMKLFF